MRLRFRILGPLEVERDGDPIAVPGTQQRALLALLLVHADQRLSTERLIELLWADSTPPRRALKSLQVTVGRLRRALQCAADRQPLETVAGGYRLLVAPDALDVRVFEAALSEGRSQLGGGAPDKAAERLAEALACWRGPVLDEFAYWTFAQAEIRRLEELRLEASELLMDAELQRGHHANILGELERLAGEHPTHEGLAHHLLVALYRCGRQADALAAFQRVRSHLIAELGLEPGPALQDLQREILEQAPSLRPQVQPRSLPASATSPDFVGRDHPLAVFTRCWQTVTAGQTAIVALSGEPGIGKSRCAEEFLSRARRDGAVTAYGRCVEDGEAPPYWPWRQLLRDLQDVAGEDAEAHGLERLTDTGTWAPGDGEDANEERFRLLDSVVAYLRSLARRRPLALAFEDLHWCDPSSLAMLGHVARALRSDRMLIVVTHRTLARTGSERLRALIDRIVATPGHVGIELDGLDAEHVARYVELTAGRRVPPAAINALNEQTHGNPLFVGELVRLLTSEERLDTGTATGVPSGLRSVLRRRAQALPSGTQELLATCAVAGTQFSLSTVARSLGLTRADAYAALEPALDDRLIVAVERQLHRFSHALAREVLYADQPAANRGARHATLMTVLVERHHRGADQSLAEIAHHAMSAAYAGLDAEPGLEWSRQAAEEARRLLAYAEAARHLQLALEACDLGDLGSLSMRLGLILDLAEALTAAGDAEAGERQFLEGAELARRLGDDAALVRAALGYAQFQQYGVVDGVAIELLESAQRVLPESDSPLRAQVMGRLSVSLDPASRQADREALLDEAIAMARRIGEPRALSRLLALSPLVHWPERSSGRRRADALETVAIAGAGGDREAALWAHIMLHTDHFAEGELPAANAHLVAYCDLAAQLRQPYYRWYGVVMRATKAAFHGRFDEARRLSSEAIAVNREIDDDPGQEWAVQQLLHARVLGRPQDVPLEELRAFAGRYRDKPLWQALLAQAECTAGNHSAARNAVSICAPGGFHELPEAADRVCTLALASEVCTVVDDADRAHELYPLLAPYAARNVLTDRSWAAWGPAARQLGLLAAALGDHGLALRHFRHAVALARAWDAPAWLVHTIRDQTTSCPRASETSALASEGVDLARTLGLPPPLISSGH